MSISAKTRWENISDSEKELILKNFIGSKWKNVSVQDRKRKMQHLYTSEVSSKKSQTLKKFYAGCSDRGAEKGRAIKEWQNKNKNIVRKQNKIAAEKAAEKKRQRIKAISPLGETLFFNSKKEFKEKHGYILDRIIKKTANNSSHNGWRAWEIE
jgi:hypothetical protein